MATRHARRTLLRLDRVPRRAPSTHTTSRSPRASRTPPRTTSRHVRGSLHASRHTTIKKAQGPRGKESERATRPRPCERGSSLRVAVPAAVRGTVVSGCRQGHFGGTLKRIPDARPMLLPDRGRARPGEQGDTEGARFGPTGRRSAHETTITCACCCCACCCCACCCLCV